MPPDQLTPTPPTIHQDDVVKDKLLAPLQTLRDNTNAEERVIIDRFIQYINLHLLAFIENLELSADGFNYKGPHERNDQTPYRRFSFDLDNDRQELGSATHQESDKYAKSVKPGEKPTIQIRYIENDWYIVASWKSEDKPEIFNLFYHFIADPESPNVEIDISILRQRPERNEHWWNAITHHFDMREKTHFFCVFVQGENESQYQVPQMAKRSSEDGSWEYCSS